MEVPGRDVTADLDQEEQERTGDPRAPERDAKKDEPGDAAQKAKEAATPDEDR
jgi:hypothetical protein